MKVFSKSIKILGCLIIPLALVYYGIYSYELAIKDISFCESYNLGSIWGVPYFWKGELALYKDLNPEGAIPYFEKTLEIRPDYIPALIELARTEIMTGNRHKAQKIATFVFRRLNHVSTWKWMEFMLAYDLENEAELVRIYNFLLATMAHRIMDANLVMLEYFGNWERIVPLIDGNNIDTFARVLLSERSPEGLWALWNHLGSIQKRNLLEKPTIERIISFMVRKGLLKEAKEIWFYDVGGKEGTLYNGSFERSVLNHPFGWQIKKDRDVVITRTRNNAYDGNFSIGIRFLGKSNIRFHHIWQIVPVKRGSSYKLQFSYSTERITTDQKPFVVVRGFRCKGLYKKTPTFSADTEWVDMELLFDVPESCEAIMIRVERLKSFMFDNKIQGRLFLDNFRLVKAE